MKTINLIFFCCLLLLVSCSRNTNEPTSPTINLALIAEVEQLPAREMGLGYMKLNPDEKALFWHHHFDKFLNNPEEPENIKAHVRKLKAFTTADNYRTLETPETQKKLKDFTKEWLLDPIANKQFSRDKLLMIGDFVGIKQLREHVTVSNLRTASTLYATECRCIYDIGCGIITGDCQSSEECKKASPTECGLTGTSRCDGKCAP